MDRSEKDKIPSIPFLKRVSKVMEEADLVHALGGSGLLYALGIQKRVNDWDLTTEASLNEVKDALSAQGILYERREGGTLFASSFRLVILGGEGEMDLIGGFAIQSDAGVCRIPTVSRFHWNGIPVGSPEVWAVAYALMGRRNQADSLFRYVTEVGADRGMIEFLLQQPLPTDVYRRVRKWPFEPKKQADHNRV
ncbi:hypothetical protein [Desmospora profundinema]|uniref:Uncharacterized protein n=1 Tax=Desmospora profundinema TaxID=1571184 RepID=A0ABU1INR0_9BACL|nr:hypothetical protein [Desmospora profundinema]MDR6225804.1 hypothetical protein [Desmospora profundinema]